MPGQLVVRDGRDVGEAIALRVEPAGGEFIHADEVEFITLMEFDSLDAIKAFVGEDITASYAPDKAREVLAHWDSHSQHYEVREQRRY